MGKLRLVSLGLLLLGILLIIYSVHEGTAKVALVFIFPVVYGAGVYLGSGILLIFVSIFLFFISGFRRISNDSSTYDSSSYRSESQKETGIDTIGKSKNTADYGGVIFIGPVPIIFGKDKSIARKMMYLGLGLALILLAIYLVVLMN